MSQNNNPYKKGSNSREAATQLLLASQAGDKNAVNRLLPLVYEEMRSIARQKLRFERKNHTLDTTALVHEAYFKLINQNNVEWQSRAHFLAIASQAMRRILINYAEQRKAVKRGGNYSRVELEEIEDNPEEMSEAMADEILALNEALNRMEEFNERGSKVVEYHFFGGLTWKEIAEVMGVAPVTVRRTWNVAKLWLRREMSDAELPAFSSGDIPTPGKV